MLHESNLSAPTATGPFAYATNSTAVNVSKTKGWSCVVAVTDATPVAVTFAPAAVNTTTNAITYASHGFATGLIVRFTTVTTLPSPLSAGVDYFVIALTANTFQVAASLSDAQAGTPIDITTQGVANHTATPSALTGASCKVQVSIDGVTYFDFSAGQVTSAQNITATGSLYFSDVDPMYRWVRFAFAITKGQITPTLTVLQKEQR